MEYNDIMNELESLGSEQTRKIYKNHGADIDMFGVSIANLKKVYKHVKNDSELGFKLLHSGNIDAIYMSQWMIDSSKVTISDLEAVLNTTNYYMIVDNVIPPIAIRNKQLSLFCIEKWIDHSNHIYRQAAYSLYSLVVATFNDSELNLDLLSKRLDYISNNIHQEENRVKYSMNGFVISVGVYVAELTQKAKEVALLNGKVVVYMGKTSCKVPDAPKYIEKVEKMNRIGRKRQ